MRLWTLRSGLIVLIILLGLDAYYITEIKKANEIKTVIATTEAPRELPFIPTKLVIPKLNVIANIEPVGRDAHGAMETPTNWNDVAWFSLGAKPGENGNAVIAGHYDNNLGLPAVFYHLKRLAVGDRIIVLDERDRKRTFIIRELRSVNIKNPPLGEIFGPRSKPYLNLITCNGVWNSTTRTYTERLVVFSELEQE